MFNALLLFVNGILSMAEDNGHMHISHQFVDALRAALLGLGVLGLGSLWVVAANDATGETRDLRAESACQALTVHRPASDVAYQAGLDSGGNAVLPADVDQGETLRLNNINIELKAPLSQLAPGRVAMLGASEVAIGTINVDLTSGVATLDGQDLALGRQRRLAEECQAPRHPATR
jgi:hypothetical protein